MADPEAGPSDPRSSRRLAARLRREIERTVSERRRQGAYGPGFEDQLDAHGRAMVAARSGPGGQRALPGPARSARPWRRLQGPELPELEPWLGRRAGEFDVVVHFSYLYTPTWAGLPVSSATAPTILHATAHDEPAFWLPVFDDLFPLPTRYAWFSEEERDLLTRRGAPRLGAVLGIGVDLDTDGHPHRFRATTQLGDRPYVVFVGRVEAGKGSEELLQFFEAYKARHPGPLVLVFVGPAEERRSHPDIVYTGYVDDQTRTDAIAGAVALVQPSFFESFSLVLTEAWAQQRPVLAQGYTDVLVGQVRRSGGGLFYRGYAEFEASLELLLARSTEADAMGRAGRDFVDREYRWDVVLGRYEQLLRQAAAFRTSPA
jgi:glycosyltransferase involved in cell wall biosynthesis